MDEASVPMDNEKARAAYGGRVDDQDKKDLRKISEAK